MILTPCIRIVDAPWKVFHGKIVTVRGYVYHVYGEAYYDCFCSDGSGAGILPESSLKIIKNCEK